MKPAQVNRDASANVNTHDIRIAHNMYNNKINFRHEISFTTQSKIHWLRPMSCARKKNIALANANTRMLSKVNDTTANWMCPFISVFIEKFSSDALENIVIIFNTAAVARFTVLSAIPRC